MREKRVYYVSQVNHYCFLFSMSFVLLEREVSVLYHPYTTDRRHRHLTFYRSNFFKMPLFLSYNSSKELVPSQGSVEILDPDRGHIMLSFPYKFILTSIKTFKR